MAMPSGPKRAANERNHLLRRSRVLYWTTYVGTGVVVDGGLGHHGVVLELRLAERRGVGGDDDKLGLAGAERLEGALVSEGDATTLEDKGELSRCQ